MLGNRGGLTGPVGSYGPCGPNVATELEAAVAADLWGPMGTCGPNIATKRRPRSRTLRWEWGVAAPALEPQGAREPAVLKEPKGPKRCQRVTRMGAAPLREGRRIPRGGS